MFQLLQHPDKWNYKIINEREIRDIAAHFVRNFADEAMSEREMRIFE